MKIAITGSNGFVGRNLWEYLGNEDFDLHSFGLRNSPVSDSIYKQNVIIHLAGKAHDVKNLSKSQEYFQANYELTKQVYDIFLGSEAQKMIFISTVKAVADHIDELLTEDCQPNPQTHYGKSKLMAEKYIQSQSLPDGKSCYILRPCLIHGPGNKGNLNLLYKLVSRNIPWPLGAFENKRSFCSIENLCFVIKELLKRDDIPSGIYNIADGETISTNELIRLMAKVLNKRPRIYNVSQPFIKLIAKLGSTLHLPLNTERLQKLTESYVVSNAKIARVIGKPFPVTASEGLIGTLQSFQNNV